jgi:hypothetical protein
MTEKAAGRSHLFTVRLWREEVRDGTEVRGSVQDLASGSTRSFRSWTALTEFLAERMEGDER